MKSMSLISLFGNTIKVFAVIAKNKGTKGTMNLISLCPIFEKHPT